MQVAAAPLFAPDCPLSGDPNPGNWGLRGGGDLVVFDWERFCRGAPALDLAAVVPSLGTSTAFLTIAEIYVDTVLMTPGGRVPDASRLAREIVLAKTWNAAELLAGFGPDALSQRPTVEWLRAHFPAWIQETAATTPTPT